ncbi:MAG: hypothetical protein LAO77_12790 [Acidobacteriia bacterium]|nr:hypothetical protein [Terriglobia bacterium]
MPTLKKATLQEIKADASAAPLGPEIEVQFNPASLRLELANRIEGGESKGKQQRQYLGKTSTTLSFDLHFDTADQGTTDAPVSVRTLTAQVEKFLLPKGEGNAKQAPPKCRFHWDELVIDGIIESVSIDFDLFASNGTPLRAKMGVSIKEQDAKYELLQSGPGANTAAGASPSGASLAAGSSISPPDRSADALEGESVADFAARMGLDPSAWRGIADGLGAASSLSLSAGLSIGFSSSLSASAGIGVSVGVEAGASASLDASFGLDASASVKVASGSSASTSSGLALTAAGGVGAALESVASAKAQSAAGDAKRSFASAAPSSAPSSASSSSAPSGAASSLPSSIAAALPPSTMPKPSLPEQSRTPLQLSGLPSPATQAATPSAPPPPAADPRTTSFGFGVPLKPRSNVTAATAAPNDPSAAPWTRPPVVSATTPASPCSCRPRRRQGAHTCQ